MLKFTWDPIKNKINQKKHRIWFEEAEQVFDDPKAILYFDKDHSDDEDRYILLGMSSAKLLVVMHCEVDSQEIRIISVRKATPKEKVAYEKGI